MEKEKLIGLVFVREPIWNKKNKSHHNCVILNKLWKEIAAECGVTATAAKAQWKRPTNVYKKLVEEPVKKSGDGVDDDNIKSEWPFYDSLLFLKYTCILRTTEGNFSAEDSMSTIESNLSDVDDGDESSYQTQSSVPASAPHSRPASPISPSTPIIKKAKKADNRKDVMGKALIRVEQEEIEYLKQKKEDRKKRREMVKESASKKVVDEDESFFNSILPHVKKFDPKTKMQFRINVLQLVHNLMPTTFNNNAQTATGPHFAELTVRQNLPSTSNDSNPGNSLQSCIPQQPQSSSTYLHQTNMDHSQREPSQNHYYPNNNNIYDYPNTQFTS